VTEGDGAVGAVKETTVFLSYFADLPDYRQKGKVAYPLDEVLHQTNLPASRPFSSSPSSKASSTMPAAPTTDAPGAALIERDMRRHCAPYCTRVDDRLGDDGNCWGCGGGGIRPTGDRRLPMGPGLIGHGAENFTGAN